MITDNVLIQGIIVVGSITTTYLTVKYKNKVIAKNKKAAPTDRMDTIFDGYEKLIKQQQQDIGRKTAQLEMTQAIIDQLQTEIDETRKIIKAQQDELTNYRETNRQLVNELAVMRKQYTDEVAHEQEMKRNNGK